jgi:hypothetical protein
LEEITCKEDIVESLDLSSMNTSLQINYLIILLAITNANRAKMKTPIKASIEAID